MEFVELPEFSRDLKRLQKKYKSLGDDFGRLKKILTVKPDGTGGKHWNCIHKNESVAVYKVRLACTYLRDNTMRVIYAHKKASSEIEFIELYYKGEKENHEEARLKSYLA